MKDEVLTVPIILGIDSLMSIGSSLNFQKAQYTLPTSNHCQEETLPFMSSNSSNALLSFYLALPLPEESPEMQTFIHQLVTSADTSPEYKTTQASDDRMAHCLYQRNSTQM